jgi:hypothetical protein
MKSRLLFQWSFIRVVYLLLGILVTIQTVYSGQWFGLVIGGAFLIMGVFNLGCAAKTCCSGNCSDGSCSKTH